LSISGADLEFIKTVGRGGFATVWLGRYKKDQEVAIKILNIEASDSTVEDFKNEAEIMRRMVHRNITTFYGIAETERGYCMVMEYLANDSLFSYMKSNKTNIPSWSNKVDFALDIARGVAFLHRLGIIHRDLKLSNILLDSRFRGKIADFGLSHTKTSQTSIVHL
jgi:serine/threonine protein kinase